MIEITPVAEAYFVKLLANQPENTRIRVFVINAGTYAAECGVSYCQEDSIEESDLFFPFDGFEVVIDEDSKDYLEEASIDYITDKLGSQLTLKAPNARAKKVADDAPLFERVNYTINAEVNPQLAGHGGRVDLIEITDNGFAILQFGGGCNGCSMVDMTLKDGIEKQLLEQFEGELNGVRDITEHEHGDHSYA